MPKRALLALLAILAAGCASLAARTVGEWQNYNLEGQDTQCRTIWSAGYGPVWWMQCQIPGQQKPR